MTTQPKQDYWQDSAGRLVPESMVKPIDRTRDQLVQELIKKGEVLAGQIATYKREAFADIAAFVELSAEQYGIAIGGKKGNVTLTSFDGRYKVVRQVQDTLAFDERLQVAKQLIDECINRWTDGGKPEVRVLINDAFQVDKTGKISTGRVLGLKRLDIHDPQWKQAMQAIGDSVMSTNSSTYVRLYKRVGDTDRYMPISLDIAGV